MNLSHYLTLDYLDQILSSKAVSGSAGMIVILFFFVGLLPFGIVLFLVPFTIYFIVVLYIHNKIGWIVGFFIWMGISILPFFLMPQESLLAMSLKFAPIVCFFLYLVLLKEKVGEWLIEREF